MLKSWAPQTCLSIKICCQLVLFLVRTDFAFAVSDSELLPFGVIASIRCDNVGIVVQGGSSGTVNDLVSTDRAIAVRHRS